MAFKLFATDMDGTLLTERKTISTRNRKALEKLYEHGVEIAICTGRPFSTVKPYLKQLQFPCWLVTNNGSVIRNKNREIISATFIDQRDLERAVRILEEEDTYYHGSDANYIYVKEFLERINRIRSFNMRIGASYLKAYLKSIIVVLLGNSHKKVDFLTFVKQGGKISNIFILPDDREKMKRIKGRLEEIKGINVTSSGASNIEVFHDRATKGHALRRLGEHLGISSEEMVAVGDNFNDLSMIQYVGLGVAMNNGEGDVKKHADWITKSNDEDGVACLIEEKILSSKELAPL